MKKEKKTFKIEIRVTPMLRGIILTRAERHFNGNVSDLIRFAVESMKVFPKIKKKQGRIF